MLWVLHLFFVIRQISCQENNVCPTIKDYYTIKTNPNCWYDYDSAHTAPEIITRAGRPFEEHKITTEDGYILTVFRMPNVWSQFKKKYPVFLQHGVLESAAMWIGIGNQSIAYRLHDQGYDVWLGNSRGSEYSTEHVRLTGYDEEYWDFSIDELALYDLPAVFKYINTKTSERIIYMGHSLGCGIALMYSSEYPGEAQKYLKFLILTAPTYKMEYHQTLMKDMGRFRNVVYYGLKYLRQTKLLSHVNTTKIPISAICFNSPRLLKLCAKFIEDTNGKHTSVGADKYPMLFNQFPAGTSLKEFKQLMDLIFNRKFSKYDYNILNRAKYGQLSPPEYKVSSIRVPIHIIYAKSDWTTSMEDILDLYNDLSIEARYGIHEIPSKYFNHFDFCFGPTSKHLFVDYVLGLLEYYGL